MKKNKILIIAWAFYPSIGGMEEQSYLLAKEFIKRGYNVDILTEKLSPQAASKEDYEGMTIYRTPYQTKRSLINLLIIFFHIKMFSLKNSDKYAFAIVRGALTFEPIAIGLLKLLKIFRTQTFTTADTGGKNDEIIMLKKMPLSKLLIFLSSQHDYLNSLCSENYEHYLALGINPQKLTKIANGIEIPSEKFDFPKRINNFLYLGRLYDYKGIRELLDAFRMVLNTYPKTKLFIGGLGPEQKYVEDFITKNDLEKNIQFLGEIKKNKKEEFYSLGDCLIQPSHSEAFSLVVYEAAARKKFIISTDVADLKNKFGDKILFCKIKDSVSLAETIISAINNPPANLNYDFVLSQVTIEKTTKEIISLMNQN